MKPRIKVIIELQSEFKGKIPQTVVSSIDFYKLQDIPLEEMVRKTREKLIETLDNFLLYGKNNYKTNKIGSKKKS